MLTHKIRDMFGNSNSGDESRVSSGGGHTSDSQTNNNNQQINFALKLEKSRSPNCTNKNGDDDDVASDISDVKENRISHEPDSDFSSLNGPYLKQDSDISKWCNKLSEMPENIAAS